MTQRSYFGNQNLTLGCVVPFAMFQMYDEPPPRPFHTFKFPHITVEVETTPQVYYDICDDMVYDRCYIEVGAQIFFRQKK